MFNVGGGELMLIALIALLVLGPDKLPDFARKSAKVLGQLRQMSQGFQNEMKSVINFDDDTDAPKTSAGPRLVGPIDTQSTSADSTGSSTPSTSSTPNEGNAASTGADASPERGSDESASGSSAA